MVEQSKSVTCENCGAPLTSVEGKGYLICSYCGAYYFPEASQDGVKLLEEPGAMTCPVCNILLVKAQIEDIQVEGCSRCHGVMIHQDQLVFIVQTLRATLKISEAILPLDQAALSQERTCRMCGHKMDTHVYGAGGNVVIDTCETCNVAWFDYGELKRVVTAPDFGSDREEREAWF